MSEESSLDNLEGLVSKLVGERATQASEVKEVESSKERLMTMFSEEGLDDQEEIEEYLLKKMKERLAKQDYERMYLKMLIKFLSQGI